MILDDLSKLSENKKITNFTKFHKQHYVDNEIDYFLNIDMPTLRKIAKKYYQTISEKDLIFLMSHKYHEYRAIALMILILQNKEDNQIIHKKIFDFYLQYIECINNWDLVDISAPTIIGKYVYQYKYNKVLYELANSGKLWLERISIVANLYLIKKDTLDLPLEIISLLLEHNHDLIHKANGWMLREIGKKNIDLLNLFIKNNYHLMPRTTLRYAIEKHDELIRKKILKGDFKWMLK